MKINRRKFLKLSVLGSFFLPLLRFKVGPKAQIVKNPDLVAIKEGSPAQMFDMGIKALGGMERFVKKGQTVLVKPNIGWNKTPSEGANTHPDLVGKIIELSYKAGAKKVYVFDNTCNDMDECYKNSGIKAAVEKYGGEMKDSDKEKYYQEVEIKGAKILKKTKVHKIMFESDVFINVPILKDHIGATMTAGLKNYMGIIWDRRFWHREGLHQCIADCALWRKPDLTVVDAYTVMIRNGPRGISSNDLVLRKMQIISQDMLLADAAAAKILGHDPKNVRYMKIAEEAGVGSLDLKNKTIKKISCKS